MDGFDCGVEQASVATELVDDVAAEPVLFVRFEQTVRADKAGDDAAAVDIGDQHDR